MRIRIELRDQNEVQKSTFFNGLESVLGSGFEAFVWNYVVKTWFTNERFLTVWHRLWDRVSGIRIKLRVQKMFRGVRQGTDFGAFVLLRVQKLGAQIVVFGGLGRVFKSRF